MCYRRDTELRVKGTERRNEGEEIDIIRGTRPVISKVESRTKETNFERKGCTDVPSTEKVQWKYSLQTELERHSVGLGVRSVRDKGHETK